MEHVEKIRKRRENNQQNGGAKVYEMPTENKFLRMKRLLSERYDFRFNAVSLDIEISEKGQNEFKECNPRDLEVELYEEGFNGVENKLKALLGSSFIPEYDPFLEYFQSLPEWKPTDPDHIEQLGGFVKAKDQEWFNSQLKKHLVRTVACSINAIPFNKQCLVLKGWQNDGKTTYIRFLCPPSLQGYITEHLDVKNKDGRLTVCNNFIINLDELSRFPRNEVNKIKSLMTVENLKERLPYAVKPVTIPRRASFFGSTNDSEFLTDSTGNVRWLIIEIEKNGIFHDNGGEFGYNKMIDIDLVWAQAYSLFKSGFKFQMTREEIVKSEKNNKDFQVRTTEQNLIQEFFRPGKKDDNDAIFMTPTQILKAIEPETRQSINSYSIGRALQVLGFEKIQQYDKEKKYMKWGYFVVRI